MAIQTIFAHLSCSDLSVSEAWYAKLFGKPPSRRPMDGLLEWRFTDSAEVQLFEDAKNAGRNTLTLGVLPLGQERDRLIEAGLEPGPIEEAKHFSIVRMRDPDGNLIVLVGAGED